MIPILHIETSGLSCSVALSFDEKEYLINEYREGDYRHSELLTVYIEQLMQQAELPFSELKAVALSSGPGSYTGLRVGASAAKAISYAHNIPFIAVSTLKSLASAATVIFEPSDNHTRYIPMIDARRMEVYTTIFDQNLNIIQDIGSLVLDENVGNEYFPSNIESVFFGSGAQKWKKYSPQTKHHHLEIDCSARHMIPIAYDKLRIEDFEDISYFSPTYLKSPYITQSKQR